MGTSLGQMLLGATLALICGPTLSETWALDVRSVPFDYASPAIATDYQPLDKAARKWRICVAYPHLKDACWLGVNYGMVQEATQLGVNFRLVEAGGYPNLDRQIEQLKACVAAGADALIVGTVSFDGLTPTLVEIAKSIPVIAAVNDIADAGITAKSGVSWHEMGRAAAEVVAQSHPKGSAPVRLAWFPGTKGAGWVRFVEVGFVAAIGQRSGEQSGLCGQQASHQMPSRTPGLLQQTGTPLQIYNDAANLFVARFIGSPGMNLLQGRPVETTTGLAIDLGPLGLIPASATEQAAASRQAKGDVVYGFRPEQAAIVEDGQGMAMPVNFVERIGARTILHLGQGTFAAKAAFENDAGLERGRMPHSPPCRRRAVV